MALCHQAKIKVTVWQQQANMRWNIEAQWCIYVLFVNGNIIGLDDGLLPVQYQAITWKMRAYSQLLRWNKRQSNFDQMQTFYFNKKH